jgi:mono/diheme cytochrome c family protein
MVRLAGALRAGLTALVFVMAGTQSATAREASPQEANTAGLRAYAQVRELMARRCVSCHGPLEQHAGLRLDTGQFVRQGGESGPAVAPGKASASLLLQRATSSDPDLRMPPEGAALEEAEVQAIADWIHAGAVSPTEETPAEDPRLHWAFLRPVRSTPPPSLSLPDGAPGNPVDRFLDAARERAGVAVVEEADRLTLLRRVTLDLTGIPPTPEAIQRFLEDDQPGAYERVVDRLLQDPAYGERWGRHWMDVWRYSDWYGRRSVPDVMNSYPHIWRWRDWIVRSLNEDAGYDEMVLQMLAADELYPGDDDRVVATGFLVRNWFKWNYENWMKDNVEHTAKAFLGLTVQCAHCHDHKFDPIKQREYFAFRAFFEPLELRRDRVPGLPDPGPFEKYVYALSYGPTAAGLVRVFDEKLDATTHMYLKGDARNRMEDEPPVEPAVLDVLGREGFEVKPVDLPPEAFYPGLRPFIRDEERTRLRAALSEAEGQERQSREELARLETSADTLGDALDAARWRCTEMSQQRQVASLALQSLETRIAADDARHRGLGDPESSARLASRSERELASARRELERLQATNAVALLRGKLTWASASGATGEVAKLETELASAVEKERAAQVARDAALAAASEDRLDYSPLSPVYPSRTTGRRAALARWIVDRRNPVAARVAVNHLWLRHFGRALVATPHDFGRNGSRPTHPELLDWLAVEFMENGWRMKPLHRLLVTSRAYRLRSSLARQDNAKGALDPDNRWYGRANPRRMEAEVVRDSLLACSRELDRAMGGQERDMAEGLIVGRRSLYFASHGEGRMPMLELFDAPDVCDGYQRTVSVRPQQALALANNELTRRASLALARRWPDTSQDIGASQDHDEAPFVRAAFLAVLSRPPGDREMELARDFLARQARVFLAESATSSSAAGEEKPADSPTQRARASLVHALFNHNDFVTIR